MSFAWYFCHPLVTLRIKKGVIQGPQRFTKIIGRFRLGIALHKEDLRLNIGAGYGIRTHDLQLGKLTLYR